MGPTTGYDKVPQGFPHDGGWGCVVAMIYVRFVLNVATTHVGAEQERSQGRRQAANMGPVPPFSSCIQVQRAGRGSDTGHASRNQPKAGVHSAGGAGSLDVLKGVDSQQETPRAWRPR